VSCDFIDDESVFRRQILWHNITDDPVFDPENPDFKEHVLIFDNTHWPEVLGDESWTPKAIAEADGMKDMVIDVSLYSTYE